MIKVIDGRRYNTETAEQLCQLPCVVYPGDFGWHETHLYRTKNGQFFIAGKGNAASMWAESVGQRSSGPGSGLRLLTDGEAQQILEDANELEWLEQYFELEDG